MPRVRQSRKPATTVIALGAAGALAAGGLVAISGVTDASNAAEEVEIFTIQGDHHRTEYEDEQVTTTGVTTAVAEDGYWIQDPDGDDDPTTSDGIFVFTTPDGTKPEVGTTVTVTGEVTEFRPGSADGTNLATTEFTDSEFSEADEQLEMPEPVLIGSDGRQPPAQQVDTATERTDVEEPDNAFDPEREALAFYESLEGMLVEVQDPEVVAPTDNYGDITVVPAEARTEHRTPNGGVRYGSYDTPNTERLTVDSNVFDGEMPDADVGDVLEGSVVGPLNYDFDVYRISPTSAPEVQVGDASKEEVPEAADEELSIATFNAENLDPGDSDETFDALADTIVTNLAAPDVVALQEVQDNTGAECDGSGECDPDGVTDADKTLDMLVEAIEQNGGPQYDWHQISPEYDQDGGQPSGNIRNVLLSRTDGDLSFVEQAGGDATTPTEVVDTGGQPELSTSPGRIAPGNDAWENSRKPLVGEFDWRGEPVFVVVNHFGSKGGDEPLTGRFQPPERDSEEKRHAQAGVVNEFVHEILDIDPDAHVVVTGDINDFEFSRTTEILTEGDALVDLPAVHEPSEERYSYNHQGNSQILDHILLSPASHELMSSFDPVRVNADFADQVSDHDPQLVRLAPR